MKKSKTTKKVRPSTVKKSQGTTIIEAKNPKSLPKVRATKLITGKSTPKSKLA